MMGRSSSAALSRGDARSVDLLAMNEAVVVPKLEAAEKPCLVDYTRSVDSRLIMSRFQFLGSDSASAQIEESAPVIHDRLMLMLSRGFLCRVAQLGELPMTFRRCESLGE